MRVLGFGGRCTVVAGGCGRCGGGGGGGAAGGAGGESGSCWRSKSGSCPHVHVSAFEWVDNSAIEFPERIVGMVLIKCSVHGSAHTTQ